VLGKPTKSIACKLILSPTSIASPDFNCTSALVAVSFSVIDAVLPKESPVAIR